MRVIDQRCAADCLRLEQHRHADLPGLGPRGAGGVLRPGRRHLAARYYGNTRALTGNNTARYLAMNLDMEPPDSRDRAPSATTSRACDDRRKRLWLSFDEWNVWYRARVRTATDGQRALAPKLLEEVYNLEDALLVGGFVNTLLRNVRSRPRRLPRAARQRHRAARDERSRRAPPEHLLPVRVGLAVRARPRARPAGGIARRIRSRPQGCGPTSPATNRCRTWTWSRRIDPHERPGRVC